MIEAERNPVKCDPNAGTGWTGVGENSRQALLQSNCVQRNMIPDVTAGDKKGISFNRAIRPAKAHPNVPSI